MPYVNDRSFGPTYYEHRKALEFSKDEFIELKNYAEARGFEFFSSFTDVNSLDFLVETKVNFLKIASQRLADTKLMQSAADTNLPIIISTGMSNMKDVEEAVQLFSKNEKYLMQCTSSYPCKDSDLNLNVISTYKEKFGGLVCYFKINLG